MRMNRLNSSKYVNFSTNRANEHIEGFNGPARWTEDQ